MSRYRGDSVFSARFRPICDVRIRLARRKAVMSVRAG